MFLLMEDEFISDIKKSDHLIFDGCRYINICTSILAPTANNFINSQSSITPCEYQMATA